MSPLLAQRAERAARREPRGRCGRPPGAALPLDLLQRGKYQPRIDMRTETLSELADSIKSQGVVQPILVRPARPTANPGESQRYEIIAGERRWRAAQMAGVTEIPAVIRDVPDEAAVAMALIENIQREDLNPLEEARALSRLIEEFGLTHQAAAEAVGRSRAAVSNLLRLMELGDEVEDCSWSSAASRWATPARCSDSATAASRSRWRRLVAKKGPVGARHRGAGAPAAVAAEPGWRAEAPSIPTSSAWSASSPTNWAPRSPSSTARRARASWWFPTTASTSSREYWRTSPDISAFP